MIQIVLHRNLSLVIACSDGMQWGQGDTSHGWQDKSGDVRRAHVVGRAEDFDKEARILAGTTVHFMSSFNRPRAVIESLEPETDDDTR